MTGLSPVAPFPSSALPEASSEAVPRLVSAQQVRSVLSRPSAFPIFSIAPVGVGRLVPPGMPIVESNLSHGVVARNPDREGGRLRWPGATEMDIACAAETPDTSIGGGRGHNPCAVPGAAPARRLLPESPEFGSRLTWTRRSHQTKHRGNLCDYQPRGNSESKGRRASRHACSTAFWA